MRRKIIIVLVCVLLLTACSDKKDYIDDYENNTNTTAVESSGNQVVDDYKFQWNSVDMKISQSNCVTQTSAYSNKGYYYISASKYVKYFDYATQQSGVWCNKLGCKHDSVDCTGWLTIENNSVSFIFYQEGKVYLVGRDKEGYYLERYNEDGSGYEAVCRLWTTNSAVFLQEVEDGRQVELASRIMALHNGKAYYAVSDLSAITLYEVKLEKGSKPKEICKFDCQGYDRISAEDLKIAGDYLVITTVRSHVKNVNGYDSFESVDTIYSVELTEHSVNTIWEGVVCNYSLWNNYMYGYITDEEEQGLYKIDLNSGEKEYLLKEEEGKGIKVYVDDKYIITFPMMVERNRKIKIYDQKLNLIDTVECEQMEDICGFDGRFMYGYRLLDYKNTPDNKGDDILMDTVWSVLEIGETKKHFIPLEKR